MKFSNIFGRKSGAPETQDIELDWNLAIDKISRGVDYRDNLRLAKELLSTYGAKYNFSEEALSKAAKRGESEMDYSRFAGYVRSGNTAFASQLEDIAKSLEKPQSEVSLILRLGALKEGAVYEAEIAKGNLGYINRLNRLVKQFGLPKENLEAVLNSGMPYAVVKDAVTGYDVNSKKLEDFTSNEIYRKPLLSLN